MLGRLIDQLLPTSVEEPEEAAVVQAMQRRNAKLQQYGQDQPWGNTLSQFQRADLNLVNLETSVTTHSAKWPNKMFSYRMHPFNLQTLRLAKIDYVSLANNHTLDFGTQGLADTVQSVKEAGLQYAGAGHSADGAFTPATLHLPRGDPMHQSHSVKVFAASDHPEEWKQVLNFHLFDYTKSSKARLKQIISTTSRDDDLRIFSVHWGPNYVWRPAAEIQEMAHFLVDDCGVDIVHGHSSHHVQGIEIRNSSVIIYGCGDFVDDYALVSAYRNDLGALWQVTVEGNKPSSESSSGDGSTTRLTPRRLDVFPTRIQNFQVNQLSADDPDHEFVCSKVANLSMELGTHARRERGEDGQLVFEIK